MRRKQSFRLIKPQTFDIRRDFGADRLQAIGAVTLAWNRVEYMLDQAMCEAAHIHPNLQLDITSRINGSEGKIGIIKQAQKQLGEYPPSLLTALDNTWGAFKEHKRYRDGVIHAVVFNTTDAIAETAQRRGKKDEVLITIEALNALYDRLNLLSEEIVHVATMFVHRRAWFGDRWDKAQKVARKKHLRYFQQYKAKYLRIQKKRLSLPNLPQFPNLPEPTPVEVQAHILKIIGYPEDAALMIAQSIVEGDEKPRMRKRTPNNITNGT